MTKRERTLWYTLCVFLGVFIGTTFFGCSHISLKAPTTQMLIKNATFLAGYEIGKAEPKLAEEIIHYTQVDTEDILVLYDSWKQYLSYRLKDPIHRRLVRDMLELVQLDLHVKSSIEWEKMIREVFKEFIAGLQAGINAQN